MFSRPAGALAFAVLLALAGWAGSVELAGPHAGLALADPRAYAGATLKVSREARVTGMLPDGRIAVWEKAFDARVLVRGVTGDVRVGDNISLVGRFVPPDTVEATAFRIHRQRFVKVWVSLPVLAWLGWMLLTRLRPTRAGIEER